jgi:hypothetical protein
MIDGCFWHGFGSEYPHTLFLILRTFFAIFVATCFRYDGSCASRQSSASMRGLVAFCTVLLVSILSSLSYDLVAFASKLSVR